MKLVSGTPYWPVIAPPPKRYAPLQKNLQTEVLVVGGGVTSALVCLAFYQAGIPVALVSDQRLGAGSTCASTALLQYEIDVDLIDLMDETGRQNAITAYRLCGLAIDRIAKIGGRFACDFSYRPSIYLAADQRSVKKLKREYEARQAAGFDVRWLDAEALANEFGFYAAAAICSRLGGEIDPYQLTEGIFDFLRRSGVEIYEKTSIDLDKKDGRKLKTKEGYTIEAARAIFASGYKSQAYLAEKVVKLRSTYAFVTQPLPQATLWKDNALWWDNADPYLYARTTADHRAMVGGGDKRVWRSWTRNLYHTRQIGSVAQKAQEYYPGVDWTPAYSWNGVFGETKDGLAYIGEPSDWKNADFALGFGGNGITYSQLAAEYLAAKYQGNEPQELALFRFGR